MADSMADLRKKAVDKAMGKGKDEEKDEPKDEMPEGGADEAPEEDMAAGEIPPQVKEALGQLPVPALKAVRDEIDRILAEVVSQDMPLGGPYLSDDELDLVRGWQAGGFQ